MKLRKRKRFVNTIDKWDRPQPKEGDVVAAVDFGTSRTALGYSVVGRGSSQGTIVHIGNFGAYVAGDVKTPTCLLVDAFSTLAFGFEAESMFADHGDENPGWRLFKNFKMKLRRHFEGDPQIQSEGKRGSVSLSIILQECLRYIQQIATAQLLDSAVLTELNTNKIHWVLTVPAIWSDSSKAMMRKSAYYAGMIPTENSHRLLLGLEPECAAIACQMWGTGTTFLVADCGGGTLDITSHEVLSTSPLRLKETCPPCGGNYGSTRVDCNFWDFFSILLGPSMFRHLKEACPAQFLELTSKWETKKVMFRFDAYMSPQILINVNNVLSALNITSIAFEIMVDNWNQQHPCREACIQNSKSKVLSMSFQLMKSFFVQPITKICDKVWLCAQKSSPEFVVLAGGFARCPMLQEYMKNCFSQSHTRVIIAQDPDLSIVRGASVFGTSGGRLIVSRKSKYTFGVDATPEYDPNNAEHVKYSEHKKLHEDGKYRLQTFHVHGHAGDDIEEGRSEKMLYYPLTELQDTLDFGILVTKKKEVFLDVEEGVERICHVSVPVDMNLPFHNRGAWFQFSLGGPEIKCRVFDATGTTELKNVKLGFTIF